MRFNRTRASIAAPWRTKSDVRIATPLRCVMSLRMAELIEQRKMIDDTARNTGTLEFGDARSSIKVETQLSHSAENSFVRQLSSAESDASASSTMICITELVVERRGTSTRCSTSLDNKTVATSCPSALISRTAPNTHGAAASVSLHASAACTSVSTESAVSNHEMRGLLTGSKMAASRPAAAIRISGSSASSQRGSMAGRLGSVSTLSSTAVSHVVSVPECGCTRRSSALEAVLRTSSSVLAAMCRKVASWPTANTAWWIVFVPSLSSVLWSSLASAIADRWRTRCQEAL